MPSTRGCRSRAGGDDESRRQRLVLVTGASSGIGLACARAFVAAGDRVVGQYLTQLEPLAALAEEFGVAESGDTAPEDAALRAVAADLSTEAGCVALVEACGAPEVLVHSAGIWNAGPIAQLERGRLEEMFRLNTFSAYYLAREMVRAHECRASSESACTSPGTSPSSGARGQGSIILISSTAGERGEPGHSHYAGSKAALWGLVQSLAQELAPAFRVNMVSPGWIRTPMTEAALADPEREQTVTDGIPMGRIGAAEDVAAAAVFLADEAAAQHLTGVDLPVSGGALLPIKRG